MVLIYLFPSMISELGLQMVQEIFNLMKHVVSPPAYLGVRACAVRMVFLFSSVSLCTYWWVA